jgi:hypothetical protein
MNLIVQQKYEQELIDELKDNHEFIDDREDMGTFIDQWIDTQTTYTADAKRIVEAFNYDVFQVDPNFDERPRSWEEAARFALYEMWYTMAFDWELLESYKRSTETV